jgi:hypothetical protein
VIVSGRNRFVRCFNVEASGTDDPIGIVAVTGSCDGLPDAPPRAGSGTGVVSHLASAAGRFAGGDGVDDGSAPSTTGYTEVAIDESTISYVFPGDRTPIVVIDATRTSGGWTVERWSAAPCLSTIDRRPDQWHDSAQFNGQPP